MAKKLMILRHAETEYPHGIDDHERRLTSGGEADAPLAGQWMVDNLLVPTQIITSDAVRARQTTTWVMSRLGAAAPTPYLDSRLYHADAAKALAIINETSEKVESLLVVGHMPWVQALGMRLASVDSDEHAVMTMAERYPTLGLQVFDVDKPWAELDGRDAVMTHFHVARSA